MPSSASSRSSQVDESRVPLTRNSRTARTTRRLLLLPFQSRDDAVLDDDSSPVAVARVPSRVSAADFFLFSRQGVFSTEVDAPVESTSSGGDASGSGDLHLWKLVLRVRSLLVAEVTVGHGQGRPVEVAGVGVSEVHGNVALSGNHRHNGHLSVEAHGDGCAFLGVVESGEETLLECLVAVVLVVDLLGEDLGLGLGLLTLGDLGAPLLQQAEQWLQHLPHSPRARRLLVVCAARHLQVVQIVVQLVLTLEHVAHGCGHLVSSGLLSKLDAQDKAKTKTLRNSRKCLYRSRREETRKKNKRKKSANDFYRVRG